MKRIRYPLYSGKTEKDKFWEKWEYVQKNYASKSFRWEGDFSVSTYEKDGQFIELWMDWEYGIPEEICYLDNEGVAV